MEHQIVVAAVVQVGYKVQMAVLHLLVLVQQLVVIPY